MLGCGLRPNTSMHGVEEWAGKPFFRPQPVEYELIVPGGKHLRRRHWRHGFDAWRQRYDRLGEILHGDDLRTGPVLAATAHLIDCRAMWTQGAAAIERDRFHFVEKKA